MLPTFETNMHVYIRMYHHLHPLLDRSFQKAFHYVCYSAIVLVAVANHAMHNS